MSRRVPILLFASLLAVGCSRREGAPLPGDSVSADGSVALTPSRVRVMPAGAAPASESAIERKLYPPELVMENQAAIGLGAAARDAIAKDVEQAHSELLRLQFELDAEKEKLVAVLGGDPVDEAGADRAAKEVMKREDAIKAGHLAMLVRIKNRLTKEQRAALDAIREAERCKGP